MGDIGEPVVQSALWCLFSFLLSSLSRWSAEMVDATDTTNIMLMKSVSTVNIVNMIAPFLWWN
jgi:hypothetical protein